jgi:hypothetical protein
MMFDLSFTAEFKEIKKAKTRPQEPRHKENPKKSKT